MTYAQQNVTKNRMTAPRAKTDKAFALECGAFDFSGVTDRACRFIERVQLLDNDLWHLFVNQYRQGNTDDADNGWRCEYWGKMMRGGALTYAYTQNPELYAVLEQTVREMLTVQDTDGRFSTYSKEKEFGSWDLWGRKYILLGMQYFIEICYDDALKAEITSAMCRHADYIISRIGRAEEGKRPITQAGFDPWQGLNSSSILEPFVRLYNLTGDKRYLDFAIYIVENGGIENGDIFELAYEGRLYPYQYPVVKAYEMMSCFEGLIELYRVTGIEKYRVAFENFVRLVAESDVTIIGCSGCTHELFDNSSVRQANTVYEGIVQETCVTVTWMRTLWQYFTLTGDIKAIDEIEQSAFNAMLGSVNSELRSENGGFPFDSYSPLVANKRGRAIGGHKVMEDGKAYGCCACIGSAGTALMNTASAAASNNGMYLNMYNAGKIKTRAPDGNPVGLEIFGNYPYASDVSIHVAASVPFELSLRIPYWSEDTRLSINGEQKRAVPGQYFTFTAKGGDVIELNFELSVRIVNAPDYADDPTAKEHIALIRGPVVLARDARFGEDVGSAVNVGVENGAVKCVPSCDAPFRANLEFTVSNLDGSTFRAVDYASAGKTWNDESRMAAWLKTDKTV